MLHVYELSIFKQKRTTCEKNTFCCYSQHFFDDFLVLICDRKNSMCRKQLQTTWKMSTFFLLTSASPITVFSHQIVSFKIAFFCILSLYFNMTHDYIMAISFKRYPPESLKKHLQNANLNNSRFFFVLYEINCNWIFYEP